MLMSQSWTLNMKLEEELPNFLEVLHYVRSWSRSMLGSTQEPDRVLANPLQLTSTNYPPGN